MSHLQPWLTIGWGTFQPCFSAPRSAPLSDMKPMFQESLGAFLDHIDSHRSLQQAVRTRALALRMEGWSSARPVRRFSRWRCAALPWAHVHFQLLRDEIPSSFLLFIPTLLHSFVFDSQVSTISNQDQLIFNMATKFITIVFSLLFSAKLAMGEPQFAERVPQLLHHRSFLGGISLYATTPETGEDGVCPSYTQICPGSCCPDGCCPVGTYCFVNGDYCCPTGTCPGRVL